MTGASLPSPPWLAMTDVANVSELASNWLQALTHFLHRPFKTFSRYFFILITTLIVFSEYRLSKPYVRGWKPSINMCANERSGRLS